MIHVSAEVFGQRRRKFRQDLALKIVTLENHKRLTLAFPDDHI
jgi:hypothetical protein